MSRPTLSFVVPAYNVAEYLAECIRSITDQDARDIEIVVVDDGSTDETPAILADLAAAESRLRIVTQPNAGLGAARNAGVEQARGEFLWFVDSDDRLAPAAVPTLLRTITTTGSDIATGNVQRLTGDATTPARFLADTFARTRLRTHVRRFPPLIADRVAWNKIYRRSFWDRHELRFPVGVHYEDQYVTIPAHYLARQVDVRREPVYLWRVRDDEVASITQQRTDPQSMRDRVAAVRYVSDFLQSRGLTDDKRRYDASAVTHDLRYFLDVVDSADQAYVEAFMTAANDYLGTVDVAAFEDLPAIRRLEWEFVRRNESDRLIDLVRYEHDDLDRCRARRVGSQWYADLPGHDDPALGLTASSFEVRRELRLRSSVEQLSITPATVTITGNAAISMIGPVGRSLRAVALPEAVGTPLRLRTTVDPAGRYDVSVSTRRVLRAARGGHDRSWRVGLLSTDHGLRRFTGSHDLAGSSASAARILRDPGTGGTVEIRLSITGRGRLTLSTTSRVPLLTEAFTDVDGVVEISGRLPRDGRGVGGIAVGDVTHPVHVEAEGFLARVPRVGHSSPTRIELIVGGTRTGVVLGDADVTGPAGIDRSLIGVADDGYVVLLP